MDLIPRQIFLSEELIIRIIPKLYIGATEIHQFRVIFIINILSYKQIFKGSIMKAREVE